jgi:uncharacterized membrane protein YhaH (DUF805 family)
MVGAVELLTFLAYVATGSFSASVAFGRLADHRATWVLWFLAACVTYGAALTYI